MAPPSVSTKPAVVITEPPAFIALITHLKGERRIALDTEAASYHRYLDRIYLLQVSSGRKTAVVDPLAINDLTPLGRLLADPKMEVVFHDADYDLRVLDRDYGFRARNLFDTRVAAQLAGEAAVGLGALLERHFGIAVDKKWQRADWSRRPIPPEMIEYAANDTRYLLRLRDTVERLLMKQGRLQWAREEFQRLESVRWSPPKTEQAFLRVKGAKALSPKALAVLRVLYEWRDARARERDRAPFRILGNDAMLGLARAAPTRRAALSRVKGVSRSAGDRYGDELLQVIGTGLATPQEKYPRIERSKRRKISRSTEARLERLKSLRNRKARALGLEAGVLCPNGTLQAVALVTPTTPEELGRVEELRNWQREALGEQDVLATIAGVAT